MGCTQSKIENEEIVTRCKERKYHMKEAVSAPNAFAAAHSLYTMALKNTGAALSDYAHAELHFLSSTTPPAVSQTSYDNLPPPPPPLPNFPSLQRASTMPEFSIPNPELSRSDPIIEEEEEEEDDDDENDYPESHGHSLRHRSTRGASTVKSGISKREIENEGGDLPIPPPSPPRTPPLSDRELPPLPRPETNGMSWDFFFPAMENVPGPSLAEVDETRFEREEIERKAFEERSRRTAEAERNAKEAEVMERVAELSQPPPPAAAAKVVKKVMHVAVPGEGKRVGKAGNGAKNLLEIFGDIQ